MKLNWRLWAALAVAVACVCLSPGALAVSNVISDWDGGDLVFRDKTTRGEIMRIKDGTDGVEITTGSVTNLTLDGVAKQVLVASSVSLTSPAKVIDCSGAALVVVTTDENQTGVTLSGGTLYQKVTLLAGSGSNTLRFDDGTSTVCGTDTTLTEGQGDNYTWICIDPIYGTIWARYNNDN